MKRNTERINQLRQDPDFRALVCLLKRQEPEQVEAFLDEHGEHDERAAREARASHNREEL